MGNKLLVTSLIVAWTAFAVTPRISARQESEGWDFVPGERLLLYDDFTDMTKGAAPPHWKVRGGALRLLDARLVSAAGQATEMWPNVAKWPKNFTIEMDITTNNKAVEDTGAQRRFSWTFEAADGNWAWIVTLTSNAEGACDLAIEIASPGETQHVACKFVADTANRYALWVQDGRLRFYLNGQRLMDLNQVKADFASARLSLDNGPLPVAIGPFRIAESAPDVSKTLFATGRYVTHGIQFDLNSAAIRAESRPVLQQIAEALRAQPSVKLRVEGHTDSTGDAAKNLDLSKRRAESVKNALIKDFGIATDRLTTDGLGDTKPAATNDTPQGRAENRRVEFVKL